MRKNEYRSYVNLFLLLGVYARVYVAEYALIEVIESKFKPQLSAISRSFFAENDS